MAERGINMSWAQRAFPEQVGIKGATKVIMQCKPTRSLKLYAFGPTFGKDS